METCLNCDTKLVGKFCHQCGQDSTTKRFNARYLLVHDLLNGLFDHKKGFYYTIYQLAKTPGNAVRNYIAGKRENYMNYYIFFGLMILLFSLAEAYSGFSYTKLNGGNNIYMWHLDNMMKNNPKLFYIFTIPVNAIVTLLLFSKAKLNFWEHFIVNTYRISFLILLNALLIIFSALIHDKHIGSAHQILTLFTTAYSLFFFVQYFRPYYKSNTGLFVRALFSILLPTAILTAALVAFTELIR